jgi:hypothetical protein
MIVYTISTSILAVLALVRCLAPTTTATKQGTGSKVWAATGCLLFLVSDTLLSYIRNVRPFPFSEGIFLAFYFLGQTCMAMSVPAWGGGKKGEEEEDQEETKQEKQAPKPTTRLTTAAPGPPARTRRAVKSKKVE